MFEEELPCGQQLGAGLLDVFSKGAALEEVVETVAGLAILVFAVADFSGPLAGLEAEDIVVAVGLAECAVVKEVVAHPHVDHGGLRGDGFDGGVRVNAGHHGEEAWIAGADKAGAAVVAWNILKEPGDGVVGVGGLVDRFGVRVVDVGAAHDEFAIAFVAAADVAADVDVAFTG